MNSPATCPRCGASIQPGSSAGDLCARCVLSVARDVPGPGEPGHKPPPPAQAELAAHFPTYEIGALLGQGATGAVYRARHRALGLERALKVIGLDVAARPGFAERFEREARTLAGLVHPNIVAIHDAGRAGPWFFLAMDLVEGADLRQMIRAARIAPREALAIVGQMCDALQFAHDKGVVHRDIKPENVLVDRSGRVHVLDFGLARLIDPDVDALTRSGAVVGTPLYMAPEQWRSPLEVDHRADIFSLGVVFYELLTGELPVGRFPPPSQRVQLDVRLDEVVLKTLEREPERRYQKASEVKTDVQHVEAGRDPRGARSSPATVAAAHRPYWKDTTLRLFVILVAVIYLLLGIVFIILNPSPH